MSAPAKGALIIGASAGALEALSVLLPALPASFPLPIFVIVHVPPDKPSVLAEIFSAKCRMRAIEAEDKEQDGAKALRAIVQAGGKAFVQNPVEAYARAMPEAALALCPEAEVVSLNEMSAYLLSMSA